MVYSNLLRRTLFVCLIGLLALSAAGCGATKFGAQPSTQAMSAAQKSLCEALAVLDAEPGQDGLLLITNAGYGSAGGDPSEAYEDIAIQATGCTPGTKSLLTIVTPMSERLWFALYSPKAGKLVFMGLKDGGFETQAVEMDPKTILSPDGWSKAAAGPMGKRTFSVVSISLSWSAGATWPMLKAAELHDHFCPGLNAGFLVVEYLKKEMPLGPGDCYVFIGAPPFCAMDAFQVMEGRTMGKKGVLGMLIPGSTGAAFAQGGVPPTLIVLRMNPKKNVCDGLVLGFDWAKAYDFTGVTSADRTPPGGRSNPMFFVSRAIMSWKMAQTPMDEKMKCIVELGRFNGDMALAKKIEAGGADPYSLLP